MAPFESFGTVSYSHSIATTAVFLAASTKYTNVTASQPPHDGVGHAYEWCREAKIGQDWRGCEQEYSVSFLPRDAMQARP